MPLYEYLCRKGHRQEVLALSRAERGRETTRCDACGGSARRVMSRTTVLSDDFHVTRRYEERKRHPSPIT
jgi:putative FmdB family regulatory protein